MLHRLRELALYRAIWVYHRYEGLTKEEATAKRVYEKTILSRVRNTSIPLAIALVGNVGSGKSFVALQLARLIGASIVNADDIRVELRKKDARYEKARLIAEDVAVEFVRDGRSVIIDSDFVDARKRASISAKIRRTRGQLEFIKVSCDIDTMLGRMMSDNYKDADNDFFGGADSSWYGDDENIRGAVVKVREMIRRLPHHYMWRSNGGGMWAPRDLGMKFFSEIDTTNEEWCKLKINECAAKLISIGHEVA